MANFGHPSSEEREAFEHDEIEQVTEQIQAFELPQIEQVPDYDVTYDSGAKGESEDEPGSRVEPMPQNVLDRTINRPADTPKTANHQPNNYCKCLLQVSEKNSLKQLRNDARAFQKYPTGMIKCSACKKEWYRLNISQMKRDNTSLWFFDDDFASYANQS